MDKLRHKYTIEFTLPGGKRMSAKIEGHDRDDAINELFKAIRAKTVIHRVEKPNNIDNEFSDVVNELLDLLNDNKPPKP